MSTLIPVDEDRLRELEQNDKRYRWLKAQLLTIYYDNAVEFVRPRDGNTPLDAAIDAELKKARGE